MPRAKTRTPELRDRLLAAALDLLARDGVAGLSARSVAAEAHTSAPALYELFGDRSGLLRAVFFEGHRRLSVHLAALEPSADARADLIALLDAYRSFSAENPTLAEVMFARPFSDFDPSAENARAGFSTRAQIIATVGRAIDAGVIAGDPDDLGLVLVSVAQGLSAAENARRLGSRPASVQRRWELGIAAVIDGLAPTSARPRP